MALQEVISIVNKLEISPFNVFLNRDFDETNSMLFGFGGLVQV